MIVSSVSLLPITQSSSSSPTVSNSGICCGRFRLVFDEEPYSAGSLSFIASLAARERVRKDYNDCGVLIQVHFY
jgi:hypothetical protein